MTTQTNRSSVPRLRRAGRTFWPLALLAPLAFSQHLPAFSFGTFTAAEATIQIALVVLAVVVCASAIGGFEGLFCAVLLGGIANYCAWWLSLGINSNISGYTWPRAAEGLQTWSRYLTAIAVNLWPLLLAASVATVVAGRRLGVPAWPAIGLLTVTLLVLATPYRADWSDGCNDHVGAAPAILTPVVTPLMDAGIGVMPDYDSTQKQCIGIAADGSRKSFGAATWNPFWLGTDGLPAGAGNQAPPVAES